MKWSRSFMTSSIETLRRSNRDEEHDARHFDDCRSGPCTLRRQSNRTKREGHLWAVAPLVAVENGPPARLIVDPPLPDQLAQGLVFIQYRTENLRVLPVFGKGALDVSPRVGHLHITVDDAPWHFVDASGETVIVVGLKPGLHQILFELADPTHKVMTSQRVAFTIPNVDDARHTNNRHR